TGVPLLRQPGRLPTELVAGRGRDRGPRSRALRFAAYGVRPVEDCAEGAKGLAR
ncbi:unnamed protein product, partial [Effrenium voratum]